MFICFASEFVWTNQTQRITYLTTHKPNLLLVYFANYSVTVIKKIVSKEIYISVEKFNFNFEAICMN